MGIGVGTALRCQFYLYYKDSKKTVQLCYTFCLAVFFIKLPSSLTLLSAPVIEVQLRA